MAAVKVRREGERLREITRANRRYSGNMNSFITQTECENSCKDGGSSRAMCLLPRAPGPCQDKIPKWYFDNFEKRCQPFYYGGCEGNGLVK